jgi:hypothetical protein
VTVVARATRSFVAYLWWCARTRLTTTHREPTRRSKRTLGEAVGVRPETTTVPTATYFTDTVGALRAAAAAEPSTTSASVMTTVVSSATNTARACPRSIVSSHGGGPFDPRLENHGEDRCREQ